MGVGSTSCPSIHWRRLWMGPRVDPDSFEEENLPYPHLGPPSPYRVSVTTVPSRPHFISYVLQNGDQALDLNRSTETTYAKFFDSMAMFKCWVAALTDENCIPGEIWRRQLREWLLPFKPKHLLPIPPFPYPKTYTFKISSNWMPLRKTECTRSWKRMY